MSMAIELRPKRKHGLTLKERLLRRYIPVTESGCWVWLGATTWNGYGRINVGNNIIELTHRVSYEQHVGPIAPSMTIDHLCAVKTCINPSHLEQVTNAVNVARGNSMSAINGRKTHCKRGHEFSEQNTVKLKDGRGCRSCERWRRNEYSIKRQGGRARNTQSVSV